MPITFRSPTLPALLLAACASVQGLAGSSVTLHNQSGQDLLIARAAGGAEGPILVTAKGDEPAAPPRRLLPPAKFRNPLEAGLAPEPSPGDEPPALPRNQCLLRAGEVATLSCADPGTDLEAELVLYRLDSEAGLSFNGIVVFAVTHTPKPDAQPEPEASLRLPGGFGPKSGRLPCDRRLKLDSPTELRILPAAAGRELKECKDEPDQPLG